MVSWLKSGTLAITLVAVALLEFVCLLRFAFSPKGRTAGHEIPKSPAIAKQIQDKSDSKDKGAGAAASNKSTPATVAPKGKWSPSVCRGENMTWDVDGIQVHVLAWRRPQSLFVLMEQLRSANYKKWEQEVPLFMHVDANADPLVTHLARSAVWPHGPVIADVRESHHGPRDMWMSSITKAAREAGSNTLMVVFEDDMRVSSVYFQYLVRVIREYGKNQKCRNSSLMGFSLSPVRLMEMRAGQSFERWRAKNVMPENKPWHTYLSSLPSTWGGAYWSDRWTEFADFVAVRSREPYYHALVDAAENGSDVRDTAVLSPLLLHVPGSISNSWTGGWKRFLVDFMYGCGLFMMYPFLEGENGLATTLGLRSTRGKASDSRIKVPTRALWQRVPRVAPLLKGEMDTIHKLGLPDFSSLAVLDLYMRVTTYEQVTQNGAHFVSRIAADADFSEMGRAWCSEARLHELLL